MLKSPLLLLLLALLPEHMLRAAGVRLWLHALLLLISSVRSAACFHFSLKG
jgi:hypothetical protein